MCLAQGHNLVTLVRLAPAAIQSRVKHSTTALPTEGFIQAALSKIKGLLKTIFQFSRT